MTRKQVGWIVIVGLAVLLAALGVRRLTAENSLARLRQTGVIRIGYAIEEPYAFLGDDGQVTGESPELARMVVGELGIAEIEWRQVEFGSLIDELEGDHIDVIAAGMFITPERGQQVAFSRPTFHVSQGLLVAAGNPQGLHSYRDVLESRDVRVAALAGSVEARLLQDAGLTEARLVLTPDARTGRVALESGLVSGLALSSPAIQWMTIQGQMGLTEAAHPFEQPENDTPMGYGGFAFRHADRSLRDAWDAALAQIIGSPQHLQMLARFGFGSADLPGTMTTEEIILRGTP